MSERLQKVLARNGIASRREIEIWIQEGKVTLNGHVAELGDKAEPRDRIEINGKRVRIKAFNTRVLLYHKPVGEICTRKDNADRPTIFDHLPHLREQKWISVGRLDINTSGLILLCNDGELVNKLMHPSTELVREYHCRVRGKISDDDLNRLRNGIKLKDGFACFNRVITGSGSGSNRWYKVELTRGKYREVRRLWEAVGGQVSRLQRLRYGHFSLPKTLPAGSWIELDSDDISMLRNWLNNKAVQSSFNPNSRQRKAAQITRQTTGNRSRKTGKRHGGKLSDKSVSRRRR